MSTCFCSLPILGAPACVLPHVVFAPLGRGCLNASRETDGTQPPSSQCFPPDDMATLEGVLPLWAYSFGCDGELVAQKLLTCSEQITMGTRKKRTPLAGSLGTEPFR